MNFLKKKILNTNDDDGDDPTHVAAANMANESQPSKTSESDLSVTHLNRLFAEIQSQNNRLLDSFGQHGPSRFDHNGLKEAAELEQRTYKLLPLFLKTFSNNTNDLLDKFTHLESFTQIISKLMVVEIRKRASNKTTEEASQCIVNFLQISSLSPLLIDHDNRGWVLLSTLNLLASNNTLIPIMASTSLPSTLIKCLYLFFDLPQQNEECEGRFKLHRIFTQLLIKLCPHPVSLHELTRKDDLALLCTAITGWCPIRSNLIWRQTAADVMLAIVGRASHLEFKYLHDKQCVNVCVENLTKMLELGQASEEEVSELCCRLISLFVEIQEKHMQVEELEAMDQLLKDFQAAHGYSLIEQCIFRLELMKSSRTLMLRLLSLLAQLTKCGNTEIKTRPLSVNQVFTMDGFCAPKEPTKTKGLKTVKNLKAFNVFITLWSKSQSEDLQLALMTSLYSIYNSDKFNYFALDSQNTLCQFSEHLHTKSNPVQQKFFAVLEHIIFELRYVPCKELISIGNCLKANHSFDCNLLYLRNLSAIIKFNPVFRDVYREVGLFEIVTDLYLNLSDDSSSHKNDSSSQLVELCCEIIQHSITGPNSSNCALFVRAGGQTAVYRHFIGFCGDEKTKHCSAILHQLILNNCDEYNLDIVLCLITLPFETTNLKRWSSKSVKKVSSAIQDVDYKKQLRQQLCNEIGERSLDVEHRLRIKSIALKLLKNLLKDSHRCRAVFRKAGGFHASMETLRQLQCLFSSDQSSRFAHVLLKKRCKLFLRVCSVIMLAMRYEPANAKLFANEFQSDAIARAVSGLGCFQDDENCTCRSPVASKSFDDQQTYYESQKASFDRILDANYENILLAELLSPEQSVCFIIKVLFEMATDRLEKNQDSSLEKMVVHPVIAIAMFRLLSYICCGTLKQLLCNRFVVQLTEAERNLQVLCDHGLIELSFTDTAFQNEHHLLHSQFTALFVRLAAQQIASKHLRSLIQSAATPLSFTTRVLIAVVELESQLNRERNVHNLFKGRPPFVEFDLSHEGFSCIFLPSIAPVSAAAAASPTSSGGGSATFLNQNLITNAILSAGDSSGSSNTSLLAADRNQTNGGIGVGERPFPPQGGFTFMSWICIERFPSHQESATTMMNNNNVRLLTIVRVQKSGAQFACLQIQLSAVDESLVICTQEQPIFGTIANTARPNNDFIVQVPARLLQIQKGAWHHIAIVFSKALLKNSTVSVYVDGRAVVTNQRLTYPSAMVGCNTGNASNTNATSAANNTNSNTLHVNAFIGTPPQLRRQSVLCWKQSTCHLLEDPLPGSIIACLHALGPGYVGSLQGFASSAHTLPLVASQSRILHSTSKSIQILTQLTLSEDKLVFGLNARAHTVMTLAKLRRVYSRFDCKQLAKLLSLSIHENATPIVVLHNSAGHLTGPARSLGGILIGYVGCRLFAPRPASRSLIELGGAAMILGALSTTENDKQVTETLQLLVRVLNCCDRSELKLEIEQRLNGYQTLGVLLRKHRTALNSETIWLLVELTCQIDAKQSSATLKAKRITNVKAFKELLIDQLDLWWSDANLLPSVFELFDQLLHVGSECRTENLRILRQLGLSNRLLYTLRLQPNTLFESSNTSSLPLCGQLKKILLHLLWQTPTQSDLLYFGQFAASLLPIEHDERTLNQPSTSIMMRNQLLDVMMQLLTRTQSVDSTSTLDAIQSAIQEELVRILGFDWFCLFCAGSNLDTETSLLGFINLFILLSNPKLYAKFREGQVAFNGGWLKSVPSLIQGSGPNGDSTNNAGSPHGNSSATSSSSTSSTTSNYLCSLDHDSFAASSLSDVKMLGFTVVNSIGGIGGAIETNLNATLNNLTIESLNESISTSRFFERNDSSVSSGKPVTQQTQFEPKKIEQLLFTIPGFQHLAWILQDHLDRPSIYLLLFQCLLGHFHTGLPIKMESFVELARRLDSYPRTLNEIEFDAHLNVKSGPGASTLVAPDLVLAILSMIYNLVWLSDSDTSNPSEMQMQRNEFALQTLRYFIHLYDCRPDLQLYCENSSDFILHLARLLTPDSSSSLLTATAETSKMKVKRDSVDATRTISLVIYEFFQRIMIDNLLCSTHTTTGRPLAKHQMQLIRCTFQFLQQRSPIAQSRLLHSLLARLDQTIRQRFDDTTAAATHFVAVHPQQPQQSLVVTNCVSFLTLLTDQCWADSWTRSDSRELLNFLLTFLHKLSLEEYVATSSSHNNNGSGRLNFSNDLPALHRCINRAFLYLLSRPLESIADRIHLLEVLQTIFNHRKRILVSPLNQDAQFITCLTYCLLQFIEHEQIRLTPGRSNRSRTTWHVVRSSGSNVLTSMQNSISIQNMTSSSQSSSFATPAINAGSSHFRPSSADSAQHQPQSESPTDRSHSSAESSRCESPAAVLSINDADAMQPDEGALLVSSSARKIWQEIYHGSKRSLLEETTRINFSQHCSSFGLNSSTQDLTKLREQLFEPTHRVWIAYLDSEAQLRNAARRSRSTGPTGGQSFNGAASSSPGVFGSTGNASNTAATGSAMANVSERLTQINRLSKAMVGSGAGLMSKLVSNTVGSSMKKDAFRTCSSGSAGGSGTAFNSDIPIGMWTLFSRSEFRRLTCTHIALLAETMQLNWRTKWQRDLHVLKYVLHDWQQLEYELLQRPRAIFGPNDDEYHRQHATETTATTASTSRSLVMLDKWKLDLTEGPNRMRKKLMRNEMFYIHYPYRPEMDGGRNVRNAFKSRQPISWDSLELHKRQRQRQQQQLNRSDGQSVEEADDRKELTAVEFVNLNEKDVLLKKSSNVHSQACKQESVSLDDEKGATTLTNMNETSESPGPTGEAVGADSLIGTNCLAQLEQQLECQSVLKLLEEGEKIAFAFKCARVIGLDSVEGLLLFGKEHFYLLDGFTILKNGELRDLDTLSSTQHDPVVPSSGIPITSTTTTGTAKHISNTDTNKQICAKFAFEDIREVHKRRYLLQPIAIELFCVDGRNALLVFTRAQRNKLYARFLSLAVNMNDSGADSLSGQRRNVSVEGAGGAAAILTSLIAEPSVAQRWARGEINNFQYLMHLNTLAGRSYNDLMQYPIFPWILADYDSPELDLTDPKVFRDLSKPMGAQSESRLSQFTARYREFDCIQGSGGANDDDNIPYHYGTFYSSAMIVASYLVRMEPFTQHFLRLQGGHFDLADRMFHSVRDAWMSASQHNMADVKELIPEFFYLPEFLLNSNRFDLGVKQSGVRLDHVQLPTWAKDDPKEFVRLHRAALESDYVSAHLHEWIDLIFGYKQQGAPAVDAVNVFHHLFYEGNVDIYTIEDPLRKNAIIGFINNFGQIPKQLFKRPHPIKKVFSGHHQQHSHFHQHSVSSAGAASTSSNSGNVFFGPNMQWPNINSTSDRTPTHTNSPPAPTVANQNTASSGSTLSTPPISSSLPLSPLITSMLGAATGVSSSGGVSSGGKGSGPPTTTTITAASSALDRLIVYSPRQLMQTTHIMKELRGGVGQIVQQEKTLLAVEQNKVLIPSQYNKYVAWGFADQSIRIGNYESDRAFAVYECDLLPCNGEILCCSVASSRMMITGGANALVSVWRMKQKPNRLELLQHLYGHDDAITCLASSASYGVLVSGSRDRTCIVWDLNRLTFVRQLSFNENTGRPTNDVLEAGLQLCLADDNCTDEATVDDEKEKPASSIRPCCNQHPAPISAICINELTGDLVTCCGSQVYLWTINGELLACADLHNCESVTSHLTSTESPSIQILCACFSLYNEWELCNVIALGCSDGAIRLLSVRFVCTNDPNEGQTAQEQAGESVAKEGGRWIRKLVLQAQVRPSVKDSCPISAVNISKDCRTMYAGDLRGRVFSFVVNG